jgi:hypothetical protein
MFDARIIPEIKDEDVLLKISRQYHNKNFEIEVSQTGVVIKALPLAAFEEMFYINYIDQFPKVLRFFLMKIFLKLFEKAFFNTITAIKSDTGAALWSGTIRS